MILPGDVAMGALLCAGLSALGTAQAVSYGRRRGLLDDPGRRRSHAVPTPRGGGIAMAVLYIVAIAVLGASQTIDATVAVAAALALAAVAAVGWWDDHRSLSIRLRLFTHFIAAAMIAVALLRTGRGMNVQESVIAILALVTAINFWNFMDGINGLAASQALLIASMLAMQPGGMAPDGWSVLALLLAAAICGFLPFNFPQARIFLGDVGSGFLGLAIGFLLLHAVLDSKLNFFAALVLVSAMLIDAGATLSMRILAGKRFTHAHREHVYQWLVRRGRSHARVTLMYAAWTLCSGFWAFWLDAQRGLLPAIGAIIWLGFALSVWVMLRRRLLKEARAHG